MLSVRATYDGNEFKLNKKIKISCPKEVIITFLDPIEPEIEETDISAAEIRYILRDGGALDFLEDDREDIYSDADLSKKY